MTAPFEPPVTLVLMTTNQGAFLAEALDSALAQDYPRLTVLVTDNASDDGTPDIVAQVLARYRGPHRLRAHRFPRFLGGPSAHVNAAVALVEDEIIVFQHGDDASEPDRVRQLVARFETPTVLLVYAGVTVIDERGAVLDQLSFQPPAPDDAAAAFARVQGYVLGAGLAIRRRLMQLFPPLDHRAAEDTILPLRAALAGQLAYVDAPLVRYRRHGRSDSHALHDLSSRAAAARAVDIGLRRHRAIAAVRRADLDFWRAAHPEQADRVEQLERNVAVSLGEAEDSAALQSSRLRQRLSAACRIAARERRPRAWVLALFQACWPSGYVAWRRGQRRRRQGRAAKRGLLP